MPFRVIRAICDLPVAFWGRREVFAKRLLRFIFLVDLMIYVYRLLSCVTIDITLNYYLPKFHSILQSINRLSRLTIYIDIYTDKKWLQKKLRFRFC